MISGFRFRELSGPNKVRFKGLLKNAVQIFDTAKNNYGYSEFSFAAELWSDNVKYGIPSKIKNWWKCIGEYND